MMRDSQLWDPHLELSQALGWSWVVIAVPVALVREDVHAIWTVTVVSHSVVPDHDHHSLDLE